MALFKNAATEWEKTMTENDLDQMEAQGLDVSKYREKLAARRAKEAEEAKRDRELYKNPTQLDKMKPYMQTPRSSETEFFKKLAGKAPWLGKSKWLRKFTEGYIVYAGIVSAPAEAWKGVKHKDDSFHGIGIYALDKGHMNDVEWLKRAIALEVRGFDSKTKKTFLSDHKLKGRDRAFMVLMVLLIAGSIVWRVIRWL